MSKSKAQAKNEIAVAAPKRTEHLDQGKRAQEDAQASKRAETLKVWKEEVQLLSSREFDSLDAAIAAVTEQLAKRMGISKQEQEFVHLLLSTDPTMTAELRRSLRIKSA
ncbi:MAG: hypothetical protein EBZ48_07605 [Proteobacteria bacterium]|nr:hypothetical protein [Pseudomonadota bacterium]